MALQSCDAVLVEIKAFTPCKIDLIAEGKVGGAVMLQWKCEHADPALHRFHLGKMGDSGRYLRRINGRRLTGGPSGPIGRQGQIGRIGAGQERRVGRLGATPGLH